jgi:uncharacterized protein
MMFVNLPVSNLKRSMDFFSKLGFEFDPNFTDERATSMIVGDSAFVMLLTRDFFKTFTKKSVCDATSSTEVIVALSADSSEAVDKMVDTALTSGGSPANEPIQDNGMYGRSFQDPDGHLWEVMHMEMASQAAA